MSTETRSEDQILLAVSQLQLEVIILYFNETNITVVNDTDNVMATVTVDVRQGRAEFNNSLSIYGFIGESYQIEFTVSDNETLHLVSAPILVLNCSRRYIYYFS